MRLRGQRGKDPAPLLAVREVFSAELAKSPEFVRQVREFLVSFYGQGAQATLRRSVAARGIERKIIIAPSSSNLKYLKVRPTGVIA